MLELVEKRPNWLFFFVLLFAFALRLFYFSGYWGSDDAALVYQAIKTVQNGFILPDGHYAARIGLILPLAGLFKIFGIGEWQVSVLAMFFNLLGIWLAYAIGRQLAGNGVGLLAAVLLTFFPLDVLYSTSYFPDLPLGVTLALAFYLAFRSLDSGRPLLWALAAGLVWGYAYLIKIEAVFLGPVFLVMLAQYRQHWLRILLVMATFGAVIVAENLVYWSMSGEIGHRLAVIRGPGMVVNKEFSMIQLWVFPKAWFVTFYEVGLYFYLLFIAMGWALWKKQWALLMAVVWVVIYLLWLQFGGNPFSKTYNVKSHLVRYMNMLSIPVMVLIAAFLLQGLKRPVIRGSVVALVIASSLFFINFNVLGLERYVAAKKGIEYAKEHGLFPLYADHTSAAIGHFLVKGTAYDDQVTRVIQHDFQAGESKVLDLDQLDGYLLLSRDSMQYVADRYYMSQLDIDELKQKYEVVYTVDNPMNGFAYLQASVLNGLAGLVPSEFVRNKVQGTVGRLLNDEDVVVFKLSK